MRNPPITIIFTNVVPLNSKLRERFEVLLKSPSLPLSRWVDYKKLKARINEMPLHDEIVYFGRKAVFWGKYTEKEYLRTSYHKLLMKEKFYPMLTIRNERTFKKLGEMLG